MKKLKYALEVNKIINLNLDLSLIEFKYFKTKKEALDFANLHDYLNDSKFYTKLWTYNDYIVLT